MTNTPHAPNRFAIKYSTGAVERPPLLSLLAEAMKVNETEICKTVRSDYIEFKNFLIYFMTRYEILRNIHTGILNEAPEKYSKLYEKDPNKTDQYNNSLSRAFIHLFLKVRFDLLDFEQREYYVTDGGNDGGIDGYYIDKEQKIIYLFQSKFRANENNFHDKEITLKELLAMDIQHILEGESM